MRKAVLYFSLLLVLATSAAAADGYAFHVRMTDGRSGLLANPDFEKLNLSEEQLERAAKDRVFVLENATGTRWRWLMLSWFDNPEIEQAIDDRGTNSPALADFALLAGSAGHFRIRCLRDVCGMQTTHGGRTVTLHLKRGELSPDLKFETGLAFDFQSN